MGRRRHRPRATRTASKALSPAAGALATTSAGRTYDTSQVLATLHEATYGRYPFAQMARDPRDRVPFGPLNPLNPAAIDPARPDTGRPEPRLTEYEVAFNLPGVAERLISWKVLRGAADNVDMMRRCIEIRKARITGMKWSWNVRPEVVEREFRASGQTKGHDDIAADLRDQWSTEINRLTAFWQHPWKSQGLDFKTWLRGVMEDRLVLDAVCIYPQTTYGGDLLGLEIIDGATIKPLLNYRGARPLPPFPAYQQILWGFPRGEYQATTVTDDDGNTVTPNTYLSDQLIYERENYRSWTPYGYSPVEQALISARLYVRRQGWMLSEYDDGVMPIAMMESPETVSWTPKERREYEQALNDDLTGQTAARHRLKLMFPGTTVKYLPDVAERYKPEYDLFLIKLMSSHFGVPATELGFSEHHGLGGTGMHQSMKESQDDSATQPDIAFGEDLVNSTSAKLLRAPAELVFGFNDPDGDTEKDADTMADARLKRGAITLNDDRTRMGKPRYSFPEADMPYVLGTAGPVFLEGSAARAEQAAEASAQAKTDPAGQQDAPPTEKPPAPAAQKAAGHDMAQAVVDQLADDYPPDALTWIHDAKWSGPKTVPLAQLDMDGRAGWSATREPDRVAQFAKATRKGKVKPAVLVRTPGSDRMKIVDGHHRALAAEALGRPLLAYVGKVTATAGPWDVMHSKQKQDAFQGMHDAPVSAPPATSDAAKTAEATAYRRFARRNHGRPFTWRHHDPDEIAALTKAADPKAQPASGEVVPPPDSRWPAWAVDTALAATIAASLSSAMTTFLPLADQFTEWATHAEGISEASVLGWLRSQGVDMTPTIGPIVRAAIVEGYAVGARSAQAVLAQGDVRDGVTVSVDWGGWRPGNTAAARKVLSDDGMNVGLQQLLSDVDVRISSIASNRLDEVAAVLADGLEAGKTPQEIATGLRGILNDPNWALLTAWTETNRAQSAAALDSYRLADVDAKEWFTANDQRVCALCEANEAQGAIGLDEAFTSGEQHPPAHPRCRCAVVPSYAEPDAEKSARAVATGHEGDAERLHEYWTRGKGLARWISSPHPWTKLFHLLLPHIKNVEKAKRTASQWYHDATGHWVGESKGKNPIGRG